MPHLFLYSSIPSWTLPWHPKPWLFSWSPFHNYCPMTVSYQDSQIQWHPQALCFLTSSSQSCHFQTQASWSLLMFILSPASSPAAFKVLMFAWSISRRSSIRSMLSANYRLFSWYPCMEIPVPLSRSPPITLSRYVMKVVGDNGSPLFVYYLHWTNVDKHSI